MIGLSATSANVVSVTSFNRCSSLHSALAGKPVRSAENITTSTSFLYKRVATIAQLTDISGSATFHQLGEQIDAKFALNGLFELGKNAFTADLLQAIHICANRCDRVGIMVVHIFAYSPIKAGWRQARVGGVREMPPMRLCARCTLVFRAFTGNISWFANNLLGCDWMHRRQT